MAIPSVLEKILATKAEEIAAGKDWVSHAELKAKCADLPPTLDFTNHLAGMAEDGPAVIAEIKKASPSAGVIREDFDPTEIAASYEQAGAACLSVLTDEPWFGGHRGDLEKARAGCSLPLLRKDFIIDPWQVHEARCLGADCILLITAALGHDQLQDLHGLAGDTGLDVLIEVHDEVEMERAMELPGVLIGVNNRNLHNFETHLEVTEQLLPMMPSDRLLVTESGIRSPAEVARLQAAGVRAFLVGEAFMREPDPGAALRGLFFGPGDSG